MTGAYGCRMPEQASSAGLIWRRAGFEPVAFCPGFLRGMTFLNGHAIVGISRPREEGLFAGLALQERLEAEDLEARCALQVIDLSSGDIVHWLRIEGVVQELYDVAIVPDARRPMALGFISDEIRRMLALDEAGFELETGMAERQEDT